MKYYEKLKYFRPIVFLISSFYGCGRLAKSCFMLIAQAQEGNYIFEFTTSQFTRNPENILVVNEPNIDRDPPNQNVLIVQVNILKF